MANDRNRTQIADQVRRMLAKAEADGSTLAEIEAFTAKANQLILEHNLAEFEIHGKTDKNPIDAYVSHPFTLDGNMADVEWKRSLLNTLAKHHFCDTVYYRGTRNVVIVGEPDNVELVAYLYNFIWKKVQKLARQNWVENREVARWKRIGEGSWRTTFCLGAAAGIGQRLRDERVAWEAATENHHALVVVKDEHLSAAVTAFFPKLSHRPSRKIASWDAYDAGVRAGTTMEIRRAIKN